MDQKDIVQFSLRTLIHQRGGMLTSEGWRQQFRMKLPGQINILVCTPSSELIRNILVLFLLTVTSYTFTNCHAEEIKTYSVGIVPQFETNRIYAIWTPILDELSKRTGYNFEIIGSPSIPEFEKQFAAGLFDFAYMNPYHMLLAHNKQGYVPLLRDVGSNLHGILVVKKDAVISVEELNGKEIAFPAPNALGASLMMRSDLDSIFKISYRPKYVKSHSSVYLNVVLGLVDAGGGVQKSLQLQPQHIQDELKVIYRTQEISPHPLAVHPRVPSEVHEKIRQAMLEFSQTEKGMSMLNKVPVKKLGRASYSDYEPLIELKLERYYIQE